MKKFTQIAVSRCVTFMDENRLTPQTPVAWRKFRKNLTLQRKENLK